MVALVAVWALTVVSVAAVTWRVIGAAGRNVLDESAVPSVTSTLPSDNSTGRRDSERSDDAQWQTAPTTPSEAPSTHGPTTVPTPSGSPSPSARPSQTPASTGTAGHDGAGHHHDPSPSPSTQPSAAGPEVGSWHGDAGVVTVRCDSGRVTLLGATPSDGYRAEVETETDRLQVRFEREEPEDEVQVTARCADGMPDFDVEGDRHEEE